MSGIGPRDPPRAQYPGVQIILWGLNTECFGPLAHAHAWCGDDSTSTDYEIVPGMLPAFAVAVTPDLKSPGCAGLGDSARVPPCLTFPRR